MTYFSKTVHNLKPFFHTIQSVLLNISMKILCHKKKNTFLHEKNIFCQPKEKKVRTTFLMAQKKRRKK
jgi:hypothetical protein